MKTSRFALLTAALLLLSGLPALADDAPEAAVVPTAPAADPADTQTPPTTPPSNQVTIVYYVGADNESQAQTIIESHTIPYTQGLTGMQIIKDEGANAKDATGVFLVHPDSRGVGATTSRLSYPGATAVQIREVSPGDTVRIHAPFIRVNIANRNMFDGEIPYQPGMTLTQVIQSNVVSKDAMMKWADMGNVSVGNVSAGSPRGRRGGNAAASPVSINYTAIASGQAKDISLSPGDWVRIVPKPFVFDGGTPKQVIKAVQDFFGEDLSMASIPPEMADVQVPKFQISAPNRAYEVLELYNKMGEKIPALGQWFWGQFDHVEGQPVFNPSNTPGLLMLIPDRSVTQANAEKQAIKAKAISVSAIPAAQWADLQSAILKAEVATRTYIQQGGDAVSRDGTLQLQPESKILIVIGTPGFIELADSVVAAYEKNAQAAFAKQLSDAGLAPPPTGAK